MGSMFLLYIAGLDGTGYREIYKTYMHFGQISDTGKICHSKDVPFNYYIVVLIAFFLT